MTKETVRLEMEKKIVEAKLCVNGSRHEIEKAGNSIDIEEVKASLAYMRDGFSEISSIFANFLSELNENGGAK